jgi:RNA polymerase sigma factor (TIGR02999 family)
MVAPTSGNVTRLLKEWKSGDASALERLLPLVYAELKRIASRHLRREGPGHTLQPTALVHEAYLRFVKVPGPGWQDRAHFFGVAARLMRQVLVDHARARRADKRGGGAHKISIDDTTEPAAAVADVDLISLDEALCRLDELDPQQARIVEVRYFGGLTIDETAEVIKVSPATVKRDWAVARAWLRRELDRRRDPEDGA